MKGHGYIPLQVLFYLTGSNQLLMDRNIKESLSGRASYFNLHTLTVHEIKQAFPEIGLSDILFKGGWPELYFWRTKEGEEIDFLIITPRGNILALDAKMRAPTGSFPTMPESFKKTFPQHDHVLYYITFAGMPISVSPTTRVIPIQELHDFLVTVKLD